MSSKKDNNFFWASRLLKDLITTWNKDKRLLHPIKARERHDKRNYIGMVNIYFVDEEIIPSFIKELRGVLLKILSTLDSQKNEIILRDVKGGLILDQNREDFELLGGFVIEAYGFTSESILLIRITHEKEKFGDKKQWVSFDVDEQKPSLWFEE
ncbi:MAG: hypothetical protein ACXACA_06210 [Candidatus Ranarchaeia archaeon]